jgi:outer membrane murein-binding lipoprotein Lpp
MCDAEGIPFRRLIAGAVIIVAMLAGCAKAPSVQARADAAAHQVSDLMKQQESGKDVSKEGDALIAALSKATGCQVQFAGGPISTDPTARQNFLDMEAKATTDYKASHPGVIIGEYYGPDHGAIVVLDCNPATPSATASLT